MNNEIRELTNNEISIISGAGISSYASDAFSYVSDVASAAWKNKYVRYVAYGIGSILVAAVAARVGLSVCLGQKRGFKRNMTGDLYNSNTMKKNDLTAIPMEPIEG